MGQFKRAFLLWMLLWLMSCASSPPTVVLPPSPTPARLTLKVGVVAPLTGPSAANGQAILHAVTMAFEQTDYTIGDYQIELIPIDSQSNPDIAARAYEQAITEQGVQVGLLNWHSSVAVAVMDMAALYKTPHFFGLGAADLIVKKIESNPDKYNYWHKAWPVPQELTTSYIAVLEEAIAEERWQPAQKRAVIYSEDTDWGHSFNNGIRPQLEGAGWTIVAEMYAALDETNFRDDLNELKNKEISLLVVSGANEAFQTSFVKQVDEVGLEAVLIADCLGCTGEWYEQTGPTSDGVLDQVPQWTTAKAARFRESFVARWGYQPGPQTVGLSYDYANFFIKIAKTAYETTGVLNSDTLHQIGVEQVKSGQITYTAGLLMPEYKYTLATGPDPLVGLDYFSFPVLQYNEGQGHIIWPEVWQTAEFQPKNRGTSITEAR